MLFYYGIQSRGSSPKHEWLSISGYLVFNFFIGSSLSDSYNPEIQPLILFTIAIGLHYFIRDHLAKISEQGLVLATLIGMLFTGYIIGYFTQIPETVSVIEISFIAGGMILNVFQCELPKQEKTGSTFFLLGASLYTVILLSLGEVK